MLYLPELSEHTPNPLRVREVMRMTARLEWSNKKKVGYDVWPLLVPSLENKGRRCQGC